MQPPAIADETEAKLHILAEVSRQITSILNIDELLVQVARLIEETFGYYHVGIGLVEGDEIVYRVGAGELWGQRDFRFQPNRLKIGVQGITGWVAKSGVAVNAPDVSKDPHYLWMHGSKTRSELVVPIAIRDQVIGVLDVQSMELNRFSPLDVEMVQSLANQAGVAIHNARLYERAKQVAVMEERQRLAAELHDSVTQALYGISLYAEAAAQHFSGNRLDRVEQYLNDIRETAKESLADMRLLLFELRPPILENEGLVSMLRTRLFSVENRAGIKTQLESNLSERLPLPEEETLFRIANEALNNALKHSRARAVNVRIGREGSLVTLEVVDDGVGFDPEAPAEGGRMGLATMKERAQARGWDLEVRSQPGSGTCVRVRGESSG